MTDPSGSQPSVSQPACELPRGNPPDPEIGRLLKQIRTVAIVGISDKPQRESYQVAEYLQKHGYRILPVNPNITEVLGEKAYKRLAELRQRPDAVVVFRRPEAVPEIVAEAKALGVQVLWLQLGIVHNAAADEARQAGIEVVQNRCIRQEHQRLIGSP